MNRIARQKRKARMRNRVVAGVEMAPDQCIVCGRPNPPPANTAAPSNGWTYLAGSTPPGAVVCSLSCRDKAIARHKATGRVDVPTMRSLP